MSRKKKSGSIKQELFRAVLVLTLSSVLALAVNAFSARGIALVLHEPATPEGQPDVQTADTRIQLDELMRAWNDRSQVVRVVDVRGEAEYDSGHIPNSVHATFRDEASFTRGQFEAALHDATLIAVLCDSDDCPKAGHAADTLLKFGYKNVRVLKGGWDAYKNSGYAIEEAHP